MKQLEVEFRHTDEEEIREISGDSSVVATPMVSAGDNFTVALMSDGTVWSWGSNDVNQLGLGQGSTGASLAVAHPGGS